MLSMCTDIYIHRCEEKSYNWELVVPNIWMTSVGIVLFKHHDTEEVGGNKFSGSDDSSYSRRGYVENSRASESLLLMKFDWLSSGMISHLLSDLGGEQTDLPFEVSDEQSEMILCPQSTFMLGRSGIGKTTVLRMKLL